MKIKHSRHVHKNLKSKVKKYFSEKKILLGLFTEIIEFIMILFTLLWAIEANAGGAPMSVDNPQVENFRAPASLASSFFPRLSFTRWHKLLPQAWLNVPNHPIPDPNLEVSQLFDEYVNNRFKDQELQNILYSNSNNFSTTLKQDPLYVPPAMPLFRF